MSGGTYTRRDALGLIAAGGAAGFAGLPALAQSPADALPAADRMPRNPRVIDMAASGRAPGRPGGTLRMLIGGQRDVRLMPMFGYARLMGYDRDLNIVPDILAACDVEDDRVYTFHLREGHRWSDGQPFTAEDFRYCWEDVINTPRLGGLPPQMKAGGEGPSFEVIDVATVRYTWPSPLADLLPNLAAPVPVTLFMPAHYAREFHERYQSEARLAELIAEQRVDDWRALHQKMTRTTRPENPNLPTLEPWRPRTQPPAQQFVFERNPYFHRVDEKGQQLPYVDRLLLNVSSYEIIPAKCATGESDLQTTSIDFSDYTVLKDAEKRRPMNVALWKRTQGSRLALYPNLTCNDMVWRKLFHDVRVRRAFSLAVNRTEINKALFFGLGTESANTVLPESPLYRPEYASAWAAHDPDQANDLLDAAGLRKAGLDGIRRLPDGRVAGIVVESAGESTLETDVLQLLADHFHRIGIALWTRVSQRDIFRSRILAGEVTMSVWFGLDNAVPTSEMPPYELAPTADDQLQWPVWGSYYYSGQRQGKPPELPEARRLVELVEAWRASTGPAIRERIWHEMLQIQADQVFSIGTVNGALQPVVRARALRNVPENGLYGYQPTSLLGIYQPDSFWLETEG